MTATVSSTFDRHAADYDAMRRRLIPCFDAFYGTLIALLAEAGLPPAPRILDLGAGTGLLSALVLERFPDAALHLVDASPGMLDRARQRFAGRTGIGFAVADMAGTDLGGPWDAIVSALAIHHLDDAGKRALFGRIRRALVPGGLFVNAEQVLGPTPEAEARYGRTWHAEIRAAGVPEEEVGRAAERMAHDQCATVEDQLGWMREAGLEEVDCSFKAWRFAVLSGRAPGEPR
ncbi:MAG: class I SAM-dependent methyltransferase [Amaricoccus sp.]